MLLNSLHNYNLSSFGHYYLNKHFYSKISYSLIKTSTLSAPAHNILFHVKQNISSQLSNLFTKWANSKTEISIPTAACRKQVLSTVYQLCHLFCPLSIAIRSKSVYKESYSAKTKMLKKFHVKQKKTTSFLFVVALLKKWFQLTAKNNF